MPQRRTAAVTGREDATCESVPVPWSQVPVLDDETLALMAKALGHPTRLRILRILNARQACITGDMVQELDLAQSTVSEHLRILREAGFITGEIEGPRTRYCVNLETLAAFQAAVTRL